MRDRAGWIILLITLLTAWQGMGQQSGVTVHVVQRGENLFRISLQYGLTVEDIALANGISNPDSIEIGQRLLIPQPGGIAAPTQDIVHIVQPGETLDSIATLYNVEPQALASQNGLAYPASVYVGQMLLLPSEGAPLLSPTTAPTEFAPLEATPASVVAAPPPGEVRDPTQTLVHIVERGDSLFSISKSYGVDASAIINSNQITDPSLIYPGQELIIPGVQPPQYAGALPEPVERLTILPLVLVEGRSARIDFTTVAPTTVSGRFLDHDLRVVDQNSGTLHTIFFGVPVGTAPSIYTLTLQVGEGANTPISFDVNLQVNPGGYPVESIALAADRIDTINANVDEAEVSMLRQVMSPFTPERYFHGLMGLPAAAPLSSPFGGSRTYNGGAYSSIHTGTDFAAPAGASIIAPAAGRVVLADTLNVRGVATVIDHGWGIYTGYWHQTERYVNLGDMVEEGQVIGAVGSTGRATGAHLHWELWVNGVPVDPMQWVSEPLGY